MTYNEITKKFSITIPDSPPKISKRKSMNNFVVAVPLYAWVLISLCMLWILGLFPSTWWITVHCIFFLCSLIPLFSLEQNDVGKRRTDWYLKLKFMYTVTIIDIGYLKLKLMHTVTIDIGYSFLICWTNMFNMSLSCLPCCNLIMGSFH